MASARAGFFGKISPRRWIGLVVAAVIVWIILSRTPWSEVADALKRVSLSQCALGLCILVGAQLLRTLKWRMALRGEHTYGEVVYLYFFSKAAGAMSPGRVGELAPLLTQPFRSGKVAALLVVDRAMEAAATIVIGLCAMLFLGSSDARILVASVVLLTCFASGLILLSRTAWWESAAAAREGRRGAAWLKAVASVSRASRALSRDLPRLFAVTLVASVMDILYFQRLFAGLGEQIGLPVLAVMCLASGIATFLAPTPFGLGVADGAIWYVGGLYGVTAAMRVAFLALARVASQGVLFSGWGLTALIRRRALTPPRQDK